MNSLSREDEEIISSDLRQRLVAAHLEPLWESKFAHRISDVVDDGHIWRWPDARSIMLDVGAVSSPHVVERRVLSMIDPHARYRDGDGTVGSVNATLQMLKPGEKARPHRHSMNALRFVMESTGGAKTIVDGQECPMEAGDLVLTPAWTWHTHVHEGEAPVIWLDVLDVALHRFLGTERFQPGPIDNEPRQLPQDAFQVANIVPVIANDDRGYSPVFRYSWADALRAVRAAPPTSDGTRRVRYANPLTGAASLSMLDTTLLQIDAGGKTAESSVMADAVFYAIEGCGQVQVGNTITDWSEKDIFTVPAARPFRIIAWGERPARLFSVSNAPVFERLGIAAMAPRD